MASTALDKTIFSDCKKIDYTPFTPSWPSFPVGVEKHDIWLTTVDVDASCFESETFNSFIIEERNVQKCTDRLEL